MSANFTPELQPFKDMRPFRIWCQKVLPLVYDDSLSYYEVLCKLVKYLDDMITNLEGLHQDVSDLRDAFNQLQGYVNNYFDNLDVQEEINNKLDNMVQSGQLGQILNNLFGLSPKKLEGNILLDVFASYTTIGVLQGACYIGNNRIVAYYNIGGTDTGTLRCYDLSSYSVLWSYPILGYHGNSVSYRPVDNSVYIVGCFIDSDQITLIPTVVRVDLSNPSVVAEVITAPVSGIYSAAYDSDTDTFYSINYRGTTEGEANRLYRWNGKFESIASYIDLQDYPSVLYGTSTQGIQCIHAGVGYIATYTWNQSGIFGYDLNTGKLVTSGEFNKVFNGYRRIQEHENIMYDSDNDRFICGFSLLNSGVHGNACSFFAEIGIYKNVAPNMFIPANYPYAYPVSTAIVSVNVNNGQQTLSPATTILKCFDDAITLGKYLNVSLNITMIIDDSNPNSSILGNYYCNGVNALVQSNSPTNHVQVEGIILAQSSDLFFRYFDFHGSYEFLNVDASFVSNYKLKVAFDYCSFYAPLVCNWCDLIIYSGNDFSNISGNYSIYLWSYSSIRCDSTLEGVGISFNGITNQIVAPIQIGSVSGGVGAVGIISKINPGSVGSNRKLYYKCTAGTCEWCSTAMLSGTCNLIFGTNLGIVKMNVTVDLTNGTFTINSAVQFDINSSGEITAASQPSNLSGIIFIGS